MRSIPIHRKLAVDLQLTEFQQDDGTLFFADSKQIYQALESLKEREEFAAVSAGELNGLQLLIKIYRHIIHDFVSKKNPVAWNELALKIQQESHSVRLNMFIDYLSEEYHIQPEEFVSETIILWLCNQNEAFHDFKNFFDDSALHYPHIFDRIIETSESYFAAAPKLIQNFSLLDLLQHTMKEKSILQQLDFIRLHFGELLGDLLDQLLAGMDILKEETAFRGGGPGPTQVIDFADEEYERFSEDQKWMSSLVLLAKSTYVWLAQLSKKYGKNIEKLDQIPAEELQEISARGISCIWLIGIWERSSASRRFKQLKGDSKAIASAYSLKNYQVAHDLGGKDAMHQLQKLAWHFGIRIGCDMVPNHMGIDSDWIIEHPDWFLQEEEPPFPAYKFFSQNLSDRNEIDIVLEDHYYDESDAAIVYKLYDKRNNKTRYIYHGNDGTSIPWNDTAQLNYLLPEVREAVIKKIISIAQQFPVIRFDAAMTLAKKHIQRLWFPPQGSGGAIPGRSRHNLSQEEFNNRIPLEFWREVVDRVAREAPDTLLLAEAFWMMEGYFVRTLGMHRVYNSAFMNMLKAEENQKYRESIKNVLAFNPQILKRFVNFMSNPDEETAIAQFGSDDKYFGVCVLMSTMPGLPMFAHGQIEGFKERYGMEFSKPSLWENPNEYLIARHAKEIFPILRKRQIFSDVENFVLYDFTDHQGFINNNVFAYSNEADQQRTLVVYHNAYQEISGFVHKAEKPQIVEDQLRWQPLNLAEAWHLHNEPNWFVIFSDAISGLIYIRSCTELHEQGLQVILPAYKYAVYWDVMEVFDTEGKFADLCEHLQTKGSRNIYRELKRMEFSEILDNFRKLVSPQLLKQLVIKWESGSKVSDLSFQRELNFRIHQNVASFFKCLELAEDDQIADLIYKNLSQIIKIDQPSNTDKILILLAGIMIPFSKLLQKKFGRNWYYDSLLENELKIILTDSNLHYSSDITVQLGALLDAVELWQNQSNEVDWLKQILAIDRNKKLLGINEFEAKIWFNLEAMEKFLNVMKMIVPLCWKDDKFNKKWMRFLQLISENLTQAKYQVDKLLTIIGEEWQNENKER